MRSLDTDGHVMAGRSRGPEDLRPFIRAAEAGGLECIGFAWEPQAALEAQAHLASVGEADRGTALRLLPVAEACITGIGGELDIARDDAERFPLVYASLGGRCPGVDTDVPARRSSFLSNIVECYSSVVAGAAVQVLARPFNLGHSPASITPAEIPLDALEGLAASMFERDVGFELFAPIYASFPDVPMKQFVSEYAALLKVFAAAGVKFVAGSGAREPGAVGNLGFCRRLMEESGIELSQIVDLSRIAWSQAWNRTGEHERSAGCRPHEGGCGQCHG